MSRPWSLLVGAFAALLCLPAEAGVFLPFDGRPANQVVHPTGYNGTGANLPINICLDPAQLPPTGDPAQAIRNAIAEFNRMQGQTGNVAVQSPGLNDFESVLVHEVGHCVGMGHTVYGPSEQADSGSQFYANASAGGNGVFNVDAGADGVRATRDDARSDDINRNWFRNGVNDPWAALPAVVDRTNYGVALANLPGGHVFVEVASAFTGCVGTQVDSSTLRGQPPTQNVMWPILCVARRLRTLSLGDVAMLRIARAGVDGQQGTADDYTTTLNYIGQASSCNVIIRFNTSTGYANCSVSATLGGGLGSDIAITTGVMNFNSSVNWHYNQTDTTGAVVNVGPTISANTPASGSTTAMAGGSVGALVTSNISLNAAGGSGSGTTALACSVGSGTVQIASGGAQTISVGQAVAAVVARFTLTGAPQAGTINCSATPQGGSVSNFSYNFTAPAGASTPVNNNFSAATTISGSSATVTGSNVGGNKESGEPSHTGNAGGASVWWVWTAPGSGSTTITTSGSNFDTLLGVYTGSAVNALATVASNDDESPPTVVSSRVTFDAVSGTTYRIAVDGFNGATGSITLQLTGPAPGATVCNGSCVFRNGFE